jgi:hypothetical protein
VRDGANVFGGDFDYTLPTGISICSFGKRAGMELLGATVYELAPGGRWADHDRVFVMTEPPYTDAPFDPDQGRILRVFKRDEATPVPPDA